MKSGDFLEMLMSALEGGESIDDRLKREMEEKMTEAYMAAFSRIAPTILMAKLLTKEERIATMDLIQGRMVEEIEAQLSSDMNSILVCASLKEKLLAAMDALEQIFDRE